MTRKTPVMIDDTGTIDKGRGLAFDRTQILAVGTARYRLRLHFDGYPDQSYLSAEFWTPNGWTYVARWTGHEQPIAEAVRPAEQRDYAVERLLTHALQVAEQVAMTPA